MAKGAGYFWGGLAEGISSGFNMMQKKQEMQWKKDAIKEGKELELKMETAANEIQKQYKLRMEDKVWSEEDGKAMNALVLSFGKEVFANHESWLKAANQGNVDAYNKSMERQAIMLELLEGIDLNTVSGKELFDFASNYVDIPEARNVLEAYAKQQTASKAPQAETFASEQAVIDKFGAMANPVYDASLNAYVNSPKPKPTKLEELQTQTSTLDNLYVLGERPFNAYVKEHGIDTTYETYRKGTPTESAITTFNEAAFGKNGIMTEYINSGGVLEDFRDRIIVKYNAMLPTFSSELRKQFEDYFEAIGIDLTGTEDIDTGEGGKVEGQGPIEWAKGVVGKRLDWIKSLGTPGGTTTPGITGRTRGLEEGVDEFGFVLGEQREYEGKMYEYMGDNKWRPIS